MEKDLSHLSSSDISTLMARYYGGESATKLMKEYGISGRASDLYKLFPPEVFPSYICEYCDEPLVIKRPSKTRQNAPRYESELYCPICGHKPFQSQCKCENCLEAEKMRLEEQLTKIDDVYSRELVPVDFSTLSFTSKVFLGALCRGLLKENMYEIAPLAHSGAILTPTDQMLDILYEDLTNNGVIAVSPRSPLSAFNTNCDDFPRRYYTYLVTYYLNLLFPENKQDLFTEILNPSYYSPECADEALALWKEIAVSECIEYLQYRLKMVGFEFTPGEKTHKTFEIILNDFSVSQIYGIIWRAVADASKLYLEKGITKIHAANSVIGACERYAERAKINGWDLTQYNRIRDLPQSVLSLFYFNRVLGIGEKGFRNRPTIEDLPISCF